MKYTFICLFLASALSLQAQSLRPAPCSSPEYRQMDFWLGEWDVFTKDGKLAGKSKIEQILGQCVILENWEGSGGSLGHSFNLYNSKTGEWEQTWVDNSGGVIYFHGKWDPEAKHLEYRAEPTDKEGKSLQFRMVFTPSPSGTVSQVWESSLDGGKTWSSLFNGTYKRR